MIQWCKTAIEARKKGICRICFLDYCDTGVEKEIRLFRFNGTC